MAVVRVEIRSGTYVDSVVLMQLQKGLREFPGIIDAAVLMGTPANRELLLQSGLWKSELAAAGPDDLLLSVRGEGEEAVRQALARFDELLSGRVTASAGEYRPRSLETALRLLPNARWAVISVPGRYAAGLAIEALELNLHIFLYSDNVALEDEVSLKRLAARQGLLVMGPDCGTSIINGVGLGFANRVSRGPIGLIGASGTGLQAVSCQIHGAGLGVSQALGTGGRDLDASVDGITTRQAIQLLGEDAETEVLVLVSKPPSTGLANRLLADAGRLNKPVVVAFQGYPRQIRQWENLHFASTLEEAAQLAVRLCHDMREGTAGDAPDLEDSARPAVPKFAPGQRFFRGLFSGGTLAREAFQILGPFWPEIRSNLDAAVPPTAEAQRQGHWILDLGADEFTVGRLHPMLDQDLRIRRLLEEANNTEVAVILLDVVLGDGAHPDPAGELGPAVSKARRVAEEAGRGLEVMVVVIGTDRDPQGFDHQIEQLEASGARVETSLEAAALRVGRRLSALDPSPASPVVPVDAKNLRGPFAAINLGLESFGDSLRRQGAEVIQVDWSPPAGGDSHLAEILRKMKGR